MFSFDIIYSCKAADAGSSDFGHLQHNEDGTDIMHGVDPKQMATGWKPFGAPYTKLTPNKAKNNQLFNKYFIALYTI
jgi:hypothetical protein